MEIKDLRNGDIVEIRNGGIYTVDNALLRGGSGKYLCLSGYSRNLTSNCGNEGLDIVKVYRFGNCIFTKD